MVPYTIVISDSHDHDCGMRGTKPYWWLASRCGAYAELGLYWFLSAYFGRSSVRLMRPSQLLQASASLTTDWLFVGLPTKLNQEHLSKIKCRRLALYDSADSDGIDFGYSDRDFLLSNTNLCLKNWRDDRWDFGFAVGLLPIKRPPLNNKLRLAIRLSSARRSLGLARHEKKHDVAFAGRPTGNLSDNPRAKWLMDLKRERPQLRIWGGLVGSQRFRKSVENPENVDILKSCWLNRKKIGYLEYFSALCQSKVALAPRGYAPWTYRHYEAVYAGSMVVSGDLRHYEFLVPLPRNGLVEVTDDRPVTEAVDEALAVCERSPDIDSSNLNELEKWMDNGTYSKRRPRLLERFQSQLELHDQSTTSRAA